VAWESRNGVGRYYTQSARVAGRVVRRYIGTGPHAELVAREDERRRVERRTQQDSWRAEREAWAAAEERVSDHCQGLDTLIMAHLAVQGFHRHKRGEWRKRRGQ
jgi:hypothetical protein